MSRYVLMPAAKEDLNEIRNYYLEEAGYRVARQMVVNSWSPFVFLRARLEAGMFART